MQDTVISSYNSVSFAHSSDKHTHTNTDNLKDLEIQFSEKKKKTPDKDHTHSRGGTYRAYTHHNDLQITATHWVCKA